MKRTYPTRAIWQRHPALFGKLLAVGVGADGAQAWLGRSRRRVTPDYVRPSSAVRALLTT